MTGPITLVPIGVVRGGRAGIFEDQWGGVISTLILGPAMVDEDATLGLGEFSHLEVIFHFHRETRVRRGAAHPGSNPAWPRVGVLAGHSPVRPNHLGVSHYTLLHADGLELTVQGLDAIDGTPILDIKPYAAGFGPQGPVHEPDWIRDSCATTTDQPPIGSGLPVKESPVRLVNECGGRGLRARTSCRSGALVNAVIKPRCRGGAFARCTC